MNPDFSPAMLKFFLRARVANAVFEAGYRRPSRKGIDVRKAEDSAKTTIRRAAGITAVQFDIAWNGRALGVAPRLKLWVALGVDPGDHGILLVDYGKQEKIRAA